MLDEGLDNNTIHRLIGRSLFILCLQDRGALNEFLSDFSNGKYIKFIDVLKNKEHTYKLFKIINEHFNGDIYPITNLEIKKVTEKHLNLLYLFFYGTDLETGQMRLWPYRFDIIPIEFISNIYEEFFHYEGKPQLIAQQSTSSKTWVGTYYTPKFLVDFILNQVLPWDKIKFDSKVLDPACGSGIFLVQMYRRLIELRKKTFNKEHLEVEDLKEILEKCIYGIDINREAICITAFNLYLTMLDYLEPKSLWQKKGLFPTLVDHNLFPNDFFDSYADFNSNKYDIIIGNVPWISVDKESGLKAISYCKYNYKTIGDKQIAQAFLWKSLDLISDDGNICLIVSSKSLLFNISNKNKKFRHEFLEETNIKIIINLSALRHSLFNRSVGPAAIVFYQKKSKTMKESEHSILYVVPKPTPEIKYLGVIYIDQQDYERISLELALQDDSIWKISMWGTPRDMDLINKARSKGTLIDIVTKKGWEIGDGFQLGGGKQYNAPWMTEFLHLPTKSLNKFYISKNDLVQITNTIFHRPRNIERYIAPLCLIKVTLKEGDVISAYSDFNVSYTDGIIGISGKEVDKDLLKMICCYLNSKLAKYFLFLTCSVWGVERDDILKPDLLNLPLILPEKESDECNSLLTFYNNIVTDIKNNELSNINLYQDAIDLIFYNLYNLNELEINLIEDTIKYTIDYFQKKGYSIATSYVDKNMLVEYVENSLIMLNSFMKGSEKSFYSKIYIGSDELKIVSFMLKKTTNDKKIEIIQGNLLLNQTLNYLSSYFKEITRPRIIRIYDSRTIYIIKPNEKRYWTKITVYKDVDDTIAEIFEAWGKEESV